jgi:hypothetical protein
MRYEALAESTSPTTSTAPVTMRGLMFGLATGSATAPEIPEELVAQASDEPFGRTANN